MGKVKRCWNCGNEVPYRIYKDIDFVPKCNCCGALYPEKTRDESLLMTTQEKYLKDRSEDNFRELFVLLNRMTFNVICHKLKIKSSYESLEDIWDKVQWTLEKLTKYYREKPDFKITTSFAQYIGQLVLYPLYNKDECERRKNEISLHTPIFKRSDKNLKELSDYLSKSDDGGISEVEDSLNYESNRKYLIDKSLRFISECVNSLYESSKRKKGKFRESYFMAQLYKFFICGKMDDKIVEAIKGSLDYSLVKKFERSVEIYKKMIVDCANGND